MAGAAILAERTRRSGFIDGLWSLATGLSALVLIASSAGVTARALVVGLLVAVWSIRLGGHLLTRTLASAADDPRYARLRREWGAAAPRRLFVFLQLQAVAGWLLAVSAAAAALRPGDLSWQDGLGVAIAVIAFGGESLADRTLRHFRARRAGAVCDVGLWAWSRHPNYFFEWLFWVGIAVVGLGFEALGLRDLVVIIAPAEMYWLLVKVSGIPLLERHMVESRGAAFQDYQARVSPFFPWPPKRSQAAYHRDKTR
ncbi:DUF1295 domain-containing protein [Rhizobiales bacterium Sp-1]|uniref:DUF1295 domain-containing protein n=2 Tax=Segnochrobactrum spirostomi TaxID=2608987 RepID=A0A6A7XZQ7_9HYPH|nr:DUF1295 domain-containing protein [Segnochrobactrum spirostomi]